MNLSSVLALSLLCSISIAQSAEQSNERQMAREDVVILNDIVDAIKTNSVAKFYSQHVGFDHVSATYSADGRNSVIKSEGLLIVQGDIACGHLGITIIGTTKRSPVGRNYETTYTATLDKSKLIQDSHCQLKGIF